MDLQPEGRVGGATRQHDALRGEGLAEAVRDEAGAEADALDDGAEDMGRRVLQRQPGDGAALRSSVLINGRGQALGPARRMTGRETAQAEATLPAKSVRASVQPPCIVARGPMPQAIWFVPPIVVANAAHTGIRMSGKT